MFTNSIFDRVTAYDVDGFSLSPNGKSVTVYNMTTIGHVSVTQKDRFVSDGRYMFFRFETSKCPSKPGAGFKGDVAIKRRKDRTKKIFVDCTDGIYVLNAYPSTQAFDDGYGVVPHGKSICWIIRPATGYNDFRVKVHLEMQTNSQLDYIQIFDMRNVVIPSSGHQLELRNAAPWGGHITLDQDRRHSSTNDMLVHFVSGGPGDGGGFIGEYWVVP